MNRLSAADSPGRVPDESSHYSAARHRKVGLHGQRLVSLTGHTNLQNKTIEEADVSRQAQWDNVNEGTGMSLQAQ